MREGEWRGRIRRKGPRDGEGCWVAALLGEGGRLSRPEPDVGRLGRRSALVTTAAM
jgi:hypothetical protein